MGMLAKDCPRCGALMEENPLGRAIGGRNNVRIKHTCSKCGYEETEVIP